MKYSGIGGQAVIEGIMMKNGDDYATAVRKPDGTIEVKKDTYVSLTEKVKILSLPFVRGIFNFADSMVLGMKSLTWSASFFEDDEGSEPGKFELFLDKVFGEKLEKFLMAFVMVFSMILAIGIFMVLPMFLSKMFLSNLFRTFIPSETVMAVLEGVIRIVIFIVYIKLISHMEDIKRTFMYHGAEHKCINCVEHGMPLTVENVWLRAASRIILIPVIAGVSYEFLRLAGRSNSCVINALSRPGMWMQALTTTEPDDSMIEVAIAAVEEVFDWKAYLRENFPESEDRG